MKDITTKLSFMDKQNISHDLVEYFKGLILSGELNPGDRIVETKFARELGISQTPVREAMHILSGEGVVTIVPNKGPVVNELQRSDVYEIYSLRAAIEGLAIRIATQIAPQEAIEELERFYLQMKEKLKDDSIASLLKDSLFIHQSIIRLSAHARLIHTYESISFQISLVNRILGSESTKEKEVEQHLELIEALKQRNPDHAEKVMRKHIYRSYREFIELDEDKHWEDGEALWF
ncbi:DNA-binding transcriptional regulator, GntR family [Paenibacillus sp. UNCCL117]|uniref:GntR family transcriptional regulator n=1 Tax=unclassified Paenibacillus TaxID=185978 RepID=UPI000890264F|nr:MULTISPECIES: GntR family transcriptional regulator [unclassified Paenibacillus]SDE10558.1 DNA-binding transcriptional regulator, GntR family [Paenibacillus sp. cl123]SFW59793.1 DNA-binding transcriptional regulator, GntR family [Paenibacillus sp. UNCCL117]